MLADNAAVVLHLNGYGAYSAVGGEYAVVVDGAHIGLFQNPLNVIGYVNLSADGVSAESAELNNAAGGIVLVFAADARARKNTVIRCSGDNENCIGGRSFTAVSHTAVDLKLFAGTLRNECGGSAAVAVCSIDAAELEHIVRHLILGEAGGERCHLTVIYREDKRSVSLDADECSGSAAAVVLAGILLGGNALCVRLNKPSPDGDSVLLPAGERVGNAAHHNLRHIVRPFLACDRMIIIVDYECGIIFAHSAERSTAVLIVIAVADVPAERFADILRMILIPLLSIPAEHCVGRYDYVAVTELLSVLRLVRCSLSAEVTDSRVHILIAGNDLYIRVVEINRSRMHYLSSGTCGIVQDDLGLSDSRGDIPFSLRNDIVVAASNRSVVFNTERKRTYGENADKH